MVSLACFLRSLLRPSGFLVISECALHRSLCALFAPLEGSIPQPKRASNSRREHLSYLFINGLDKEKSKKRWKSAPNLWLTSPTQGTCGAIQAAGSLRRPVRSTRRKNELLFSFPKHGPIAGNAPCCERFFRDNQKRSFRWTRLLNIGQMRPCSTPS